MCAHSESASCCGMFGILPAAAGPSHVSWVLPAIRSSDSGNFKFESPTFEGSLNLNLKCFLSIGYPGTRRRKSSLSARTTYQPEPLRFGVKALGSRKRKAFSSIGKTPGGANYMQRCNCLLYTSDAADDM
eukprot:1940703-Rhodomonas_salina.1